MVGHLIAKDQTRFIPATTFDNIRCLYLNIQDPLQKTVNGAVLTLDASKAIDHVEWSYLCQVLRKMGFGPNFME